MKDRRRPARESRCWSRTAKSRRWLTATENGFGKRTPISDYNAPRPRHAGDDRDPDDANATASSSAPCWWATRTRSCLSPRAACSYAMRVKQIREMGRLDSRRAPHRPGRRHQARRRRARRREGRGRGKWAVGRRRGYSIQRGSGGPAEEVLAQAAPKCSTGTDRACR